MRASSNTASSLDAPALRWGADYPAQHLSGRGTTDVGGHKGGCAQHRLSGLLRVVVPPKTPSRSEGLKFVPRLGRHPNQNLVYQAGKRGIDLFDVVTPDFGDASIEDTGESGDWRSEDLCPDRRSAAGGN